jgi:hypothetical protein
MSIRTIKVIARVEEDLPTSGKAVVQRLLSAWMPLRFQPFAVSGLWSDQTLPLQFPTAGADWNGLPLWPQEQASGGELTKITPHNFQRDLVTDLQEGEFGCVWHGSLYHAPPFPAAPAVGWYGRAKIPSSHQRPAQLWELAQVSLEWSHIGHYVAVRFPIGGYPITLCLPPVTVESALQKSERADLVEQNRHLLFEWMVRLPANLGWAGSVEWEINSEDALFDEDLETLRDWEQRLNTGVLER